MDPYLNLLSYEVININKFKQHFGNLAISMKIPEVFKNPPNFRKTKDLIPNRYEVYIYRSYKVIISFIDNDNFIRLNKINGAL